MPLYQDRLDATLRAAADAGQVAYYQPGAEAPTLAAPPPPARPRVMVDELTSWPGAVRGRLSCHMTVDGDGEKQLEALHLVAASIGLRREWFQAGPPAHYDLTLSKREAALRAGAEYVPAKEQALERVLRRRGA